MSGKLYRKGEVPDGLAAFLKAAASDENVQAESIKGARVDRVILDEVPDVASELWNEKIMPAQDQPFITEEMAKEAGMTFELGDPAADRAAVLQEAIKVVTRDRNSTYGEAEDSFTTIADLWSVYLGIDLLPQDVAALMTLLKVARVRVNPGHRDSWVDIAGYAACGATMLLPTEEQD